MVSSSHRDWVDALPALLADGDVEFNKAAIVPYAYRHSYAQRHADAGVPPDVLRDLMGHRTMRTTQTCYRITGKRMRQAVERVAAHQFDRNGQRTWQQIQGALDDEHTRLRIGQVSVPFGICMEPGNIKAGGQPARFDSVAWAAATSAPMPPTSPSSRTTSRPSCATANASWLPTNSTPGPAPKQPLPRPRSASSASSSTAPRTPWASSPTTNANRSRTPPPPCAAPARSSTSACPPSPPSSTRPGTRTACEHRRAGLGGPPDHDALQKRINYLEQHTTELQQQLADRDDDLDAARAANRQLIASLDTSKGVAEPGARRAPCLTLAPRAG
ncbi:MULTISPECIES: hypothetical protein [unclassified Streptomyces]|uniref:hypothetical protein n=1 Tax=unclassified Streptomyces TaxID=2593676 RepID=UPI001BE51FBD|nr:MULTISPECIES: hypothetical protein [unclassified Streptomyces]MBT2408817.1 site-specific integrase [Streptomyces sp. ISL-21]MBT2613447.1 site-specific integrase [Streptomyces sp. ISL-87]